MCTGNASESCSSFWAPTFTLAVQEFKLCNVLRGLRCVHHQSQQSVTGMSINHNKTFLCLGSCLRKLPALQTATSRLQHTHQMVPLLLHQLLTWKASSRQLPHLHSLSLKGLGHSSGHHKVSSSIRAGPVSGPLRQAWGHSQASLSLAWKCCLVRRWATCQVGICMYAFVSLPAT